LAGNALRLGRRHTNPAPDFKEVYDLLRTNLAGATDDNLNRAAIEGLLSRFPGKVSLVGGATDGSAIPQGGAGFGKSAVLENDVVYLRVASRGKPCGRIERGVSRVGSLQ